MEKTYHGSCHCGAIRFEAEVDLGAGIRKCNCSFCWKLGYRKALVPFGAMRIVQGEHAELPAEPFDVAEGRHRSLPLPDLRRATVLARLS